MKVELIALFMALVSYKLYFDQKWQNIKLVSVKLWLIQVKGVSLSSESKRNQTSCSTNHLNILEFWFIQVRHWLYFFIR
jgi:hypothetical protein